MPTHEPISFNCDEAPDTYIPVNTTTNVSIGSDTQVPGDICDVHNTVQEHTEVSGRQFGALNSGKKKSCSIHGCFVRMVG